MKLGRQKNGHKIAPQSGVPPLSGSSPGGRSSPRRRELHALEKRPCPPFTPLQESERRKLVCPRRHPLSRDRAFRKRRLSLGMDWYSWRVRPASVAWPRHFRTSVPSVVSAALSFASCLLVSACHAVASCRAVVPSVRDEGGWRRLVVNPYGQNRFWKRIRNGEIQKGVQKIIIDFICGNCDNPRHS